MTVEANIYNLIHTVTVDRIDTFEDIFKTSTTINIQKMCSTSGAAVKQLMTRLKDVEVQSQITIEFDHISAFEMSA